MQLPSSIETREMFRQFIFSAPARKPRAEHWLSATKCLSPRPNSSPQRVVNTLPTSTARRSPPKQPSPIKEPRPDAATVVLQVAAPMRQRPVASAAHRCVHMSRGSTASSRPRSPPSGRRTGTMIGGFDAALPPTQADVYTMYKPSGV